VSSTSGPIGHLTRSSAHSARRHKLLGSRLILASKGKTNVNAVTALQSELVNCSLWMRVSAARQITSSTSHLSPRQAGRFIPDMTGAQTPTNQILIW